MTIDCVCCRPLAYRPSATRRGFLQLAAAAAATLPAAVRAQGAAPAAAAKRIDVHHHVVPAKYMEAVAGNRIGSKPRPWSPEISLAEMDRNGIDTAIVSIVQPGVWFKDNRELSRSMARDVNELGARMMQDHPGRFGFWAAIPLPNIDDSLREIEYAFDTLKADGIGLMTSFGPHYLGDPAFAPIYEELDRRKAVIYIHPQTPDCCRGIADDMDASSIEYATDTTRAIGSVVFSGTASRYRNIRWIWSHSGGTMPFLLSRFEVQDKNTKDRARIPDGAIAELKRFYYDTAQGNHKGALEALLALAPVSQVLFGTDYPLRNAREEVEALAAFGFSPADLAAIQRGNATRLLPRLGRA